MTACIAKATLQDFRIGKAALDPPADVIATHLAECGQCQLAFEELPDLPIVDWLFPRPASGQRDRVEGNEDTTDDRWLGCLPPGFLLRHPKWECLRLLGKGGVGAVYLARQRQFPDRLRALKVLQPRSTEDEQFVERFRREIVVALDAVPSHENIVRGYDAEASGTTLLLVMEYVLGESLESYARRQPQGKVPYQAACGYLLQVLYGLHHATKYGVVHRDLKPGNLMLTPEGTIKILDFGLAKVFNQVDGQTASGLEFCGTAKYCSPEQAKDFRSADIRSDIYSLGCTLYRLIAGVPPFGEHSGHTSMLSVYAAHAATAPPALAEHCSEAPPELCAVVDRMLAKRPNDRYATPLDAAQALYPFADRGSQGRARAWLDLTPDLPPVASKPQPAERPDPSLKFGILPYAVAIAAIAAVMLWGMVADPFASQRQEERRGKTADATESAFQEPPASSTSRATTDQEVFQGEAGAWLIDGTELLATGEGDKWLAFGDPNWRDYTFSFEVRKLSGPNGIGAVFRSDQGAHAYHFVVGGEGNAWRKLEQIPWIGGGKPGNLGLGQATTLARFSHPETLKPQAWHTVKVIVQENEVRCFLDGILGIEFDDLPAPSGGVGLRVEDGSARFRKLKVADLRGKILWEGLPRLRSAVPASPIAATGSVNLPADAALPPTTKRPPAKSTTRESLASEAQEAVLLDELETPIAFFGSSTWTDVNISFEFRKESPEASVFALCRARNEENGIRVALGMLGNHRHQVDLLMAGRPENLASQTGELPAGVWHKVLLTLRGNRGQCYLNGVRLLHFEATALKSGRGAVGVLEGSASIRNVNVSTESGEMLWQGLPKPTAD
jgi:serine/threonine protein kinase